MSDRDTLEEEGKLYLTYDFKSDQSIMGVVTSCRSGTVCGSRNLKEYVLTEVCQEAKKAGENLRVGIIFRHPPRVACFHTQASFPEGSTAFGNVCRLREMTWWVKVLAAKP